MVRESREEGSDARERRLLTVTRDSVVDGREVRSKRVMDAMRGCWEKAWQSDRRVRAMTNIIKGVFVVMAIAVVIRDSPRRY